MTNYPDLCHLLHSGGMGLEHALLVALREQPAAGADLARRFERSIGFFWHATHQQIYRTLARMEADGWVDRTEVPQTDRPTKLEYAVTKAGERVLEDWVAEPTPMEPLRSELALKLRAASLGDRAAVRRSVEANLADHQARLAHYRHLEQRDHPDPEQQSDQQRDQWLVLRGGIRLEEFWTGWLTEILEQS